VNWAESTPGELIRACARPGNSAAWTEFVSRYHSIVRFAAFTVARRWGQGAQAECDDLVQEIYLKLCANGCRALLALCDIQAEALQGYLKVIAVNAAHDYFRARAAQRRGASATEPISEHHEAVLGTNEDMEERLTIRKIDDVLDRQTQLPNGQRDRAVFRLYYWQGMTAKEIAGLTGLGLTIKGVEAVLHRLTGRIQEALGPAQGIPRGSRQKEVGGV
jgi:RNA polymerase sigma-70 factor (ECF subfamily)